jgi:hypothetical protein
MTPNCRYQGRSAAKLRKHDGGIGCRAAHKQFLSFGYDFCVDRRKLVHPVYNVNSRESYADSFCHNSSLLVRAQS